MIFFPLLKPLLVAVLLCLTYLVTAQDDIEIIEETGLEFVKTKDARTSLKIAQAFANKGAYRKAKKQLEYTIKIKENFAVAHRELGRINLELGLYTDAIDALEKSFEYDDKISRAAYYECAESYFYLGQISQAKHYYSLYESKKNSDYTNKRKERGLEKKYDEEFEIRMENLLFIANADTTNIHETQLENLGENINSQHNEYLPAILSNGQRIVYTRDKKGRSESILTAVWDKEKGWTKGRALDQAVNTHSNEGMAKFSPSGKRFYFTGCKRKDTQGGCDIYEAEMSEFGEVTQVKHVEGINTYYWDSQPCVSCNEDVIYFSSNRPEGYGGTDIYMSVKKEDGTWSQPFNLGPDINTKGDEEAPFIAADGATLYFTSTGLPGFGDGDLFVTRRGSGQWLKPENLGFPFNSFTKELGFFLQGDGKTAYFASAREGGEGGLDIYKAILPEKFRPSAMNHVEGIVVDDETNRPIKTPFMITRVGERYYHKSDEKGQFFTCLKQNKAYTFQLDVEGYQAFMSAVYLPPSDNAKPTFVEIRLIPEKKVATVKNKPPKATTLPPEPSKRTVRKRVYFYFDINSAELGEQTQNKLDDLINTIKFDDKWKIEVIGFADSSGDAAYNKILSEKRANAVAGYLEKSGINIDKVSQEGRGAISGESEQERKKSRRVEVLLEGTL